MRVSVFLLILSFALPTFASPQGQVQQSAEAVIMKIFGAIVPMLREKNPKAGEFSVAACKADTPKWIQLFLTGQTFTQRFQFAKNCDVQGDIVPNRDQPFPIELALRHIELFDKVRMDFSFDVTPGMKLNVKFYAKNIVLSGAQNTRADMNADYELEVDLLNNMAVVHKGGMLEVKNVNQKPINVKRRFLLKN